MHSLRRWNRLPMLWLRLFRGVTSFLPAFLYCHPCLLFFTVIFARFFTVILARKGEDLYRRCASESIDDEYGAG